MQLKQVVDKIGPELLLMEGFYILSSVQLPHTLDSIEGLNMWETHQKKEVHNQVDLCTTIQCEHPQTEEPEAAARQALGETCGIEVSDAIWSEPVQIALRQRLGIQLPTRFKDASGMQVVVTLIPEDAAASKLHGVLCFCEPAGVDYLTADGKKIVAEVGAQGAAAAEKPAKAKAVDEDAGGKVQGKTVREWEQEQQKEFANEPKLPSGWIRIKSRSSGDVYYFNKLTKESTFEVPLPTGWTKQVSKSTGKSYYYHAQKRMSTFERPEA